MHEFERTPSRDPTIRIGASGWNYPAGPGAWNGVFYPARSRRPRGFDELAFYARYFNTVEVNTTFYRPPTAAMTARWAARTPGDFEFAVKLFQKFTHPTMFNRTIGAAADAEVHVDQRDVDEFQRAIEPIAAAGKLGPLLAQFPSSFVYSPEARDYLGWLLRAFGPHQIAVELRHRSWSDRHGETVQLLNEGRAAWVQIDEPKFRLSVRQNALPNVDAFYYMRMHGRNAAKWWTHDHADERYDYLYSAAELQPVAETAQAVRRLVRKLYLYMNNHFASKAIVNAFELKHALGQDPETGLPETLVERYPALRALSLPATAPPAPERPVRPAREPDLLDALVRDNGEE
jgi:uncharacterized protein YecE (DUF72 family)